MNDVTKTFFMFVNFTDIEKYRLGQALQFSETYSGACAWATTWKAFWSWSYPKYYSQGSAKYGNTCLKLTVGHVAAGPMFALVQNSIQSMV